MIIYSINMKTVVRLRRMFSSFLILLEATDISGNFQHSLWFLEFNYMGRNKMYVEHWFSVTGKDYARAGFLECGSPGKPSWFYTWHM